MQISGRRTTGLPKSRPRSRFENRRWLNRLLQAVEVILAIALLGVLAEIGLALHAAHAAARPQPEGSAAASAHRLQIPAIGVDSLIYEGWDEESLRRGVGQRPGSPAPGEAGNLLLSAHNDIHGAIFRHLDQLKPGDAVYISTENVIYTYLVRDVLVVSPDSVWVTLPTAEATATLISCYPYVLGTQRIVVFADFAGQVTHY